jgi:hypothetical protein
MSFTEKLIALLSSFTEAQIRAMTKTHQQLLSDQLRRVYRIIEGDRIVEDAREATDPSSGVLRDLNGRQEEWR